MFETILLNFVKKRLNACLGAFNLIVTHYLPDIFSKTVAPIKIIVALP